MGAQWLLIAFALWLLYSTTRIRPGLADGRARWSAVRRAGARVAS